MSEPTVIGVPGAVEQRIRYNFSPFRGRSQTRHWKGPKLAILALLPQLEIGGYEYQYGPADGQNYEVFGTLSYTVTGSGPNDPSNVINTWELFPGAVEKALLRSDVAAIVALSQSEKNTIQTSIQNNDDTMPSGLSTNGQAIWNFMKLGETSVLTFAPTIRHTQTVSNQYTIPAANTNVARIITTGSMSTLENIPNTILFTLPTTVSGQANLAYGWLKMPPTVTVSAFNKVEISQEWQYGLWNTLAYGAAL